MNDKVFWSAARIARAIRKNELTTAEIVNACLDRIKQVNPKINAAVQVVTDQARREAEYLDRMAARNRFKGPLHGVPISIKDSLNTEGITSTGGTLGRKDFVPKEDAPVVARLRAAGAVLIAKTNTPELTLSGETSNLIYGRTNNPFDLDKSPGGSSGGSAALIAAGGSALELGSDTGGSIREPAHLCGVTGIKPTSGQTPRTGHIIPFGMGALDSLTQIGPMARYVEDLALALPIICGPDGCDPATVPVAMGSPDEIDLSGLRIACYTDNGVTVPCRDVRRVVEETASALSNHGMMVDDKVLPEIPEMAEFYARLRRSCGNGNILRLLDRFGTTEPGPELKRYLTTTGSDPEDSIDPVLLESIDAIKSRALSFMSRYDAILCPASHQIARPHGASGNDSFLDWSHITIQNLLGWPCAVVRAGTSESDNLPVGVQVVGAPWREDIALALAAMIETTMGGYQCPDI